MSGCDPVGKSAETPENRLISEDTTLGPLFDRTTSGITVGVALEWAAQELGGFPQEEARLEARILLSGLLEMSPTHLHLNRDQELGSSVYANYLDFIHRRKNHEPVAYILKKAHFRGLDLCVNPDVLIPRPETEWVVEKALEILKIQFIQDPAVLEMGTGSGCIAISLVKEMPEVRVWASDISSAALRVAQANADRLGAGDRLQIFQSDFFEECGPKWKGYFDMIISNPPYISSSKLSQLDPDLGFEPRGALDGGPLGLSALEKIIKEAKFYLKGSGTLVLEIGFDQGESVRTMLTLAGYKRVEIFKDLNRHDRIAVGSGDGSI